MKIALINPPSPFLTDERVAYNSGIMRVATHLKAKGYNTSLIDLAGDKNYLKTIKNITVNEYDLYAFSSTTPQFPMVYNMNKIIKQINPKTKTMIGGAHASAISSLKRKGIPDHNIDILDEFDIIFEGEGEGNNIDKMFNGKWIDGGIINNIDDTLKPDRSLMDIKSYKYNLNGKHTTNIQTQRGCPNNCNFCCGRNIPMYKRVRQHSVKRVIEEMDELNKNYGFDSFMFYDDEININMGRLEKLCKALSIRPYQHRGFVTSDMVYKYPESIKWMKDAGFVKLCTGVESGSDRILKIIGKKSNNYINMKAREIIKEQEIHYEAFVIVGHPSETMKDIRLTYKFIRDAKPDDFDIGILTPYPGSKIYDESIRSHKYKGYKWEFNGLYFNKPNYAKEDSYYRGSKAETACNSRTDELSNDDLIDIQKNLRSLKNEN